MTLRGVTSWQDVALPLGLKALHLRGHCNESLAAVSFPCLHELSLAGDFNRRLTDVALPQSLRRLSLGPAFRQSLQGINWPDVEVLILGSGHNLKEVQFPKSLRSLTFLSFDESLEGVCFPPLESLTLGGSFNQSLEKVDLPSSIRSLTFGAAFNQSLQLVKLPSELQSLSFGDEYNHSLQGSALQSLLKLCLGTKFQHSLPELPYIQELSCRGVMVSTSANVLVEH